MAELTIDLTYGNALYEAAKDLGKKEEIKEDAKAVIETIKENPDLKSFINYPAISAIEKKKTIANIFTGHICEEFLNFLYVLIDKGRTGHLESIIKTFQSLSDREEGYSYGTVFSVENLSQDRIKNLEEDVSKLLKINVKLENEIDKKLIGGIKILIEDKILDASIKKKFEDLQNQIILN